VGNLTRETEQLEICPDEFAQTSEMLLRHVVFFSTTGTSVPYSMHLTSRVYVHFPEANKMYVIGTVHSLGVWVVTHGHSVRI
jgi:hypothetical protein